MEFRAAKATTPLQAYGIEPELRDFLIPLNVHMGRFVGIAGIKEEPIRAAPVNRWHLVYALLFPAANELAQRRSVSGFRWSGLLGLDPIILGMLPRLDLRESLGKRVLR